MPQQLRVCVVLIDVPCSDPSTLSHVSHPPVTPSLINQTSSFFGHLNSYAHTYTERYK